METGERGKKLVGTRTLLIIEMFMKNEVQENESRARNHHREEITVGKVLYDHLLDFKQVHGAHMKEFIINRVNKNSAKSCQYTSNNLRSSCETESHTEFQHEHEHVGGRSSLRSRARAKHSLQHKNLTRSLIGGTRISLSVSTLFRKRAMWQLLFCSQ